MEFPHTVSSSRLFAKLTEDAELLATVRSLRDIVVALAATTARSVPHFTDHTIRHMDALWSVADHVLTPAEIDRLNAAEAFLLGCAFYLHDIGMAYAATDVGLQRLRDSVPYKAIIASAPKPQRLDTPYDAQAIAIAVRQLHAEAAKELAVHEIPGTDGLFLFEARSVRDSWGPTCGDVASTHHWNLTRLETAFGTEGFSPLPGNRRGDLLYVCSCLRLIDYAHINRERASFLDRAFRGTMNSDSLIHWMAQEQVDGPVRDRDELVYRASNAIANVDAWWLYYEMLTGLDSEIRSVKRMLDQRREEHKTISLSGVRGVGSPEQAAKLIPTSGFLPIEINLRTGSIDRLVELLAGETLYGPNPMAAIRELVQNARDAVLLKAALAIQDADRALLALPISVALNTKSDPPTLEVVDHGVGMTRRIMTDYLIAIASDYWSSQFASDFPDIAAKGFKHAGKFGIGFLSVFMLGEEVQVESNRAGGERYRLDLRGVGRRGELREVRGAGGSGTAIRIKLKPDALEKIKPLEELLPVYAPTLPHGLVVSVDGTRSEFKIGWIKALQADHFEAWMRKAILALEKRSPRMREVGLGRYRWSARLRPQSCKDWWPHEIPEFVDGNTRRLI
jgi:Histidine kinase-, DNA gyrase B-, and HSP90-like ATPase